MLQICIRCASVIFRDDDIVEGMVGIPVIREADGDGFRNTVAVTVPLEGTYVIDEDGESIYVIDDGGIIDDSEEG